MVLCDIGQNGLNIVKIQQILKVINKIPEAGYDHRLLFLRTGEKEVVFAWLLFVVFVSTLSSDIASSPGVSP